ncbi:hypothetical protein AKJ09_05308 [Labilithrix luteola]|uniref:Uncharacterized protein n=1 Tax=Labilithrix luteola TaxID=1391654 RepID=A0A0K1PZR5_9BACT|nr:hypothetical protein AKJ09_05308 [Labilithrix luteola]
MDLRAVDTRTRHATVLRGLVALVETHHARGRGHHRKSDQSQGRAHSPAHSGACSEATKRHRARSSITRASEDPSHHASCGANFDVLVQEAHAAHPARRSDFRGWSAGDPALLSRQTRRQIAVSRPSCGQSASISVAKRQNRLLIASGDGCAGEQLPVRCTP